MQHFKHTHTLHESLIQAWAELDFPVEEYIIYIYNNFNMLPLQQWVYSYVLSF